MYLTSRYDEHNYYETTKERNQTKNNDFDRRNVTRFSKDVPATFVSTVD